MLSGKYLRFPAGSQGDRISPETTANLLSKIVFWWAHPLLAKGAKKPIEEEDLYYLPNDLRANNFPPPTINWFEKWPLLKGIVRQYWRNFWWVFCIELSSTIPLCLGPFLVQTVVFSVQSGSSSISDHPVFTNVWQAVVSLFLSRVAISILQQQFYWWGLKTAIKFNAMIMSMVYQKALKTSSSTKSTGKLMNIMSLDAEAIFVFTWSTLTLGLTIPIQVIALGTLVCIVIGPSGLLGALILAIAGYVQKPIANRVGNFYEKSRVKSDERVKLLTEILQGIRVIKYYNWEQAFQQRVQQIRDGQMAHTLNARQFELWGFVLSVIVVGFAAAVSFTVYSALGNTLTAEIAFTSLALFQAMNLPIRRIPMIVTDIANISVSTKSIQLICIESFLLSEDIQNTVEQTESSEIKIKDADFFWDANKPTTEKEEKILEEKALLKDDNEDIPAGKLTCVVGPVGSGKSAIVQAILGELFLTKGSISVPKSLSYTPQSPWLLSGSIRDNILFGKSMDKKRYEEVLVACALAKDISSFAAGDLSEIGEKGINLSGGQQHRISLARALYANESCCIMDEPLSAVDPHVAKWLFEKCIQRMMADKTRVLVTHQLQFLSSADLIVVLDHGEISHTGTYSELVAQGLDFETIMRKKFEKDEEEQQQQKPTENFPDGTEEESKDEWTIEDLHNAKPHDEDKGRITTNEERQIGAVPWGIYKQYLVAAGSIYYWIGMIGIYTITQFCTLGGSFWIAEWTNKGTSTNTKKYAAIYFSILVLVAICQRICGKCLLYLSYHSGENLHKKLLGVVMGAKATFFDMTPSGRLMNRFSKDQGKLDISFMLILNDVIECGLTVTCTILTICVLTPLFIVPCVILAIPFYLVQQYYRKSARELKRLQSISFSSVLSTAAETSNGISVIRAFKLQDDFSLSFRKYVDRSSEIIYNEYTANRWLDLRLEWVANCLVFAAASVAVIAMNALGPGLVGVVITSTMAFSSALAWTVRQFTELETSMNAVERITHYCNTIPQEEEEEEEEEESKVNLDSVPENWPAIGRVEIQDLVIKYRPDLDPVLRGINCSINPGEKIGVVGRTGAGKTTLTSAIFRMIEANSGKIIIDGINIADINLKILRSRLSIIPQDPVLFSGSIRLNLDPYNQHSDNDIWSVLAQVHLKDHVSKLPDKLDYSFKEGGSDFSLGQKQLICLGRALLRNSKILIMDEATASLDFKTDELIKTAVRECFASKTLITIAHRLDTILDSDRVMVFDQGKIIEFDSPAKLLSNPSSMFAMSVNAARKSMYRKK